jgi:hypothetical protein
MSGIVAVGVVKLLNDACGSPAKHANVRAELVHRPGVPVRSGFPG